MVNKTAAEVFEELKKQIDHALLRVREELDRAYDSGLNDKTEQSIHKIGNIANSLPVSMGSIRGAVEAFPLAKFAQCTVMLEGIANNEIPMEKLLLIRNYQGGLHTSLKEGFQLITDELEEMNARVQQIRGFLEQDRLNHVRDRDPREISLAESVRTSVAFHQENIYKYNIRVHTKLEEDMVCLGYPLQVRWIVRTLIGNALSAVTTNPVKDEKIIRVDLSPHEDMALLSVADNGLGIEAEHLGHLFEPGYVIGDFLPGFRLHTCSNYIRSMGGTLAASSKGVGHGSVFLLTLPQG